MTALYRSGVLIIIAFLLAALTHVSAILLVPSLTLIDSWTKLAKLGDVGTFALVTTTDGVSDLVPRNDPMTIIAICRYDLDDSGPVRISGRLNLPYWGFFAHDRRGMVYYAINNRAFGERPLSLRVMTGDDVVRFRADLPEDAEQELLVASPDARGFVLIRALVPFPGSRLRVEAELKQLECRSGQ